MIKQRDLFLDRLRTLAIVWVLLVHVLYWLNFLQWGMVATVKSWLLLEMPLFFFITGAGLSLSEPKPWGRFVLRSYRRMLIPYWCYALLCIGITAIHDGAVNRVLLRYWLIPDNPQPASVEFLSDALWYVPIYLLCALLIPLLRRWVKRPLPVLVLMVTMLLAGERQGWYYVPNVAVYSLWIYAGLHYPQLKARYIDRRGKRWELLLTAAVGATLVWVLCQCGGGSPDIQTHKFPPDGVFLAYSLCAMSLFALAAPGLVWVTDWLGRVKILDWAMDRLGRYSLTVFLYQSLAFLLLREIVNRADAVGIRQSVQFPICCVLIVVLAVILAVVFGPLENLGRRKNS